MFDAPGEHPVTCQPPRTSKCAWLFTLQNVPSPASRYFMHRMLRRLTNIEPPGSVLLHPPISLPW